MNCTHRQGNIVYSYLVLVTYNRIQLHRKSIAILKRSERGQSRLDKSVRTKQRNAHRRNSEHKSLKVLHYAFLNYVDILSSQYTINTNNCGTALRHIELIIYK